MTPQQSVVIQAHCYQPPREDPWLEVVETEPSALPDHDWNTRINRECYERLGAVEIRARDKRAALRDPDARSGLLRVMNMYAWCTFDAGATLCEWLQQEAPRTLQMMIEGDAASVKRLGYGNAIAAPYHHVILPLASRRDKVTEVRWGLADFRRRFGREAQGMWLPECAVDEETLEVLADEGVQFTILAPYQIRGASGDGMPVRWRDNHGRSLAILPYDGNLAGEVAFGNLLQNPGALAQRLAPFQGDSYVLSSRCTTLATDGETFGHHHKSGDTALATALLMIAERTDARVTNAAALIAEKAPTTVVHLVSPSSWSCAHGVERWRSDCGCRLDSNAKTSQRWRRPLRESMDWLAHSCNEVFEKEGQSIFSDNPWEVRDRYGGVVANDGSTLTEFARNELRDPSNADHLHRAQELLELERAVLRTFTSCAWFFDDVARIETRQVLRYAARAIELSGQSAQLQSELLKGLSLAVSNVAEQGSAADLYLREALPAINPSMRAAAAAAALRAVGNPVSKVASFDVTFESGRDWNATIVSVTHRRTNVVAKYSILLTGAGAELEMTAATLIPPFAEPIKLAISDLPEAEARQLLLKSATT
ncbi:MAG: DUF3536 domain-containing protein [Gemmatimonadaceae bacterium]